MTIHATNHPTTVSLTITINAVHHVVHVHSMTGAELAILAGISGAGNQLFLEVNGHADDPPIRPDETVHLHDGMKFYDVPVGNLG